MPEGYNPSDDSEEEYVPPSKNKKINLLSRSKRGRKEDDSDSDDEDSGTPVKKLKGKKLNESKTFKRTANKPKVKEEKSSILKYVSSKPNGSPLNKSLLDKSPSLEVKEEFRSGDKCPLCNEKLTIEGDEAGSGRLHLAIHYYDQNKYAEENILVPDDADEEGRPQNDMARKYSCKYVEHGCKRRPMGYKEACAHLATQHQLLKQLLDKDSNKKMNIISRILYGGEKEEPKASVAVKKEKVEPKMSNPFASGMFGSNPNLTSMAAALENGSGGSGMNRRPYSQAARLQEEAEDDPDDPEVAAPPPAPAPAPMVVAPSPAARRGPRPRARQVQPAAPVQANKAASVSVDKIMNCPLCNEKDGKNLSSNDLRYHVSLCVYAKSGFFEFLPHNQGENKVKREDVEEYRTLFKYYCPYEDCDKYNSRRPMGYKEFSIHMGSTHGVLERWSQKNCPEVYEVLKSHREERGEELPEIKQYQIEEAHICLLCNGGDDKEGFNLGFQPEKIRSTRFHYSSCLYNSEYNVRIFALYSPKKNNKDDEGRPRDIKGTEVKYKCLERGCTNKRNMGYKEYVIHSCNEHGGLEKILDQHENEELRKVVKKMKLN